MDPIFTEQCGLAPEEIRRCNSRIAELFSLYLNLSSTAISKQDVEGLATDCGISSAEAFAHYLAAIVGLDAGGADRLFFQYWLRPAIRELDTAAFTQDAYFQNVRIPNKLQGKWELRQEVLQPYELFVCDDLFVTQDRRMIPQIGFFKKTFRFPAVLENGREWMTLQPNEMVTARPALSAAKGRVLAFGLGLGYFAFHAAQKPEVESVTVVDISPDAIALFQKNILPQFRHKEKIRLINADAFAFADTRLAGNFDFVFADIWHDAGDGCELYLRMKEYEKKHPAIHFTYWLEDTLRCYLDKELWK